MDRNNYRYNHVPATPRRVALVDQYMWPVKDTTAWRAVNGWQMPVYDCQGNIHRTLPLDKYPVDNGRPHPWVCQDQIFPPEMTQPGLDHQRQINRAIVGDNRLEGFYNFAYYSNRPYPMQPPPYHLN
jgi:hypothetical protein